jgi:hypothetical protein
LKNRFIKLTNQDIPMKKTILTVILSLSFILPLHAGEFDDEGFGGAEPFTAFDIKGGFLFGTSDDAIGFENRVGPQFGVQLTQGISAYVAWGFEFDYGYTVTSIGTGKTTSLTNTNKEVKEEVDVTGHSFDLSPQIGLTIPFLDPIHLYAMVGPGVAYYMINHQAVTFSDGSKLASADEKFWGITFVGRVGMAWHFDETTGMIAEIGVRLGKLTNLDDEKIKSPHDGYSLRAGFRFLFE